MGFLQFVFQDFWHFIGVLILMCIAVQFRPFYYVDISGSCKHEVSYGKPDEENE